MSASDLEPPDYSAIHLPTEIFKRHGEMARSVAYIKDGKRIFGTSKDNASDMELKKRGRRERKSMLHDSRRQCLPGGQLVVASRGEEIVLMDMEGDHGVTALWQAAMPPGILVRLIVTYAGIILWRSASL
ncbi:hypothetical protein BJ138DRAFT_1112728 [Hygrophoropsis aurantiaca]|uniref:Uncharacterized protein n=1 Tax=Hygrophoropsis aurantiaca TaxID=72124 RepID=A0ACB8AEL2_9AGAM|nr:hypothetical protein BJ138DRAFT_1112728 [Hygrophoropsis aurantiaca]